MPAAFRANGAERLAHLPGLWFTGMRPSLTGFFHAACTHGRVIARQIARAELARPARAGGTEAAGKWREA
jgi:hypothetical protein